MAIVDEDYHLLASKARENVDPMVPLNIFEKLNSVFPVVVTDSASPLVQYCGSMRAITIQYEKLLILIHKAMKRTILLAVSPKESIPEAIVTKLDKIMSSPSRTNAQYS